MGDLWLSPECRLLADCPGHAHFVYDGKGHRVILPEGLDARTDLPLIVVGTGKTLVLQNVRVVFAASLAACVQLGAGEAPGLQCLCNLQHAEALDNSLTSQYSREKA